MTNVAKTPARWQCWDENKREMEKAKCYEAKKQHNRYEKISKTQMRK